MARAGIRYEDVEQAAEALARSQVNPTHERIRQALGGGSFSTIGRHLQTWRQSQVEDGAAAQDAVPPDSLVDAVKGVWQGMRGAAEARVADIEASTRAAISEAQTAAQAQLDTMAQAHTEALAQRDQAALAQDHKMHADAALAAQREKALTQQLDVQARAQAALDIEHRAHLVQAAEQAGRLAAAIEQCAALKEAAAVHAAQASSVLEAERARMAEQLTTLRQSHQSALAALAAERDTAQSAYRQSLAAAQAQTERAQAQMQQWQRAQQATQAEMAQLQARLTSLERNAEAAKAQAAKRLADVQAEAQALRERSQRHETALHTLRGETQGRVHVIEELREAFNALAGERLVERRQGD